ncbi:MAG: Serine/threonine kinase [Myxococcaceae bacterium]|nr:Serine/threonine kinase [Myxococcaceae bacterium]
MTDFNDPNELIGTTIADKYTVESVVGEGGFATVYKATHILWKRPVALKVFGALHDFPPEQRERLLEDFVREGALLAELSEQSAAICQARDVGTVKTKRGHDVPYMVLEWLEGSSFEQVLEDEAKRGMPLRTMAEVVRLLDPVAHALRLAHERGIAHRDVKPANIFVIGDPRSDRAQVKILDFGIAKVVQDAQRMAGSFHKTTGQTTSFTPAYGAPEQFSRTFGATGPWTDSFALALIVTESVTGRVPLEGETIAEVAYASVDVNRRPTPRTFGATVSDAVEAVFVRALAVKPEERYATAGELWEALRAAVAGGVPIAEPSQRLVVSQQAPSNPFGATVAAPDSPNVSAAPVAVMTPATPAAAPAPRRAWLVGLPVALLVGSGIVYMATRKGPPDLPPVTSTSGSASAATSASAAGSAPSAVANMPACPDGMVPIQGGPYFMGNAEGGDNEKPEHKVVVSPYCIDRLEVSTNDYKKCSDDGECNRAPMANEWSGITAQEHKIYDPLCNIRDVATKGTHPINCVTWTMASTFCHAHKKRLPTEAEWEFAARGKDGRHYPWGDDEPSGGHLNACGLECVAWGKANKVKLEAMYPTDDGFATTSPVGSFPAGKTIYGAEDMVGNVWEWVEDAWAPYEKGDPDKPLMNPKGPPVGEPNEPRVIRGGAWNSEQASWLRPSFRYFSPADKKSYGVGFRCAR